MSPDLMRKRRLTDRGWPARHGYKQIRCAVCYRRFMPWHDRIRGANYFPHPFMLVHQGCGTRLAGLL